MCCVCVCGCSHRLGLWMDRGLSKAWLPQYTCVLPFAVWFRSCRGAGSVCTCLLVEEKLSRRRHGRWACVPVIHCSLSSRFTWLCLPPLLTDASWPGRAFCSFVPQRTTSRPCHGSSLWSPVSTRTSTRSPTSGAPCAKGSTTSGSVSGPARKNLPR